MSNRTLRQKAATNAHRAGRYREMGGHARRIRADLSGFEALEERLVLSELPSVSGNPSYQASVLEVGGGNDTTGIAVLGSSYGTTDAFQEAFEIRGLAAPHPLIARIGLSDLRAALGVPAGGTSGGPDGMTSVTAFDGSWYVIATSPFSTDGIFKIAPDGSTATLFSNREIFNRGDSFNFSEIEFYSSSRAFLAESDGLVELDGSGQLVRTIAPGDFNGVAVVGNALYAMRSDGVLVSDPDLTDGDPNVTTLFSLQTPIRDLTYGEFGTVGEALFVATNSGDIGYWPASALTSGQPLGPPTWLFNIPDFLGKITFSGGDFFASLGEDAVRVHDMVGLEAIESDVSVVEGAGPLPVIRLHLTAPPRSPVSVSLAQLTGDPDISVVADGLITFDDKNWRADQVVRLQAAPDADADSGTAVLRASLPGGFSPVDITIHEHDKDGPLGIELLQPTVAVREGRTATFQVRLTAAPMGPITVTTRPSLLPGDDPSLRVEEHSQLTFNANDWYRWRWVSLAADPDADATNGTATLTVAAPGLASQTVRATEQDSAAPAVYQVLVDDYVPLPLQGETHEFDFFNRVQGDHGKIENRGTATIGRGFAEARPTSSGGFAGVFHSLNHTIDERIPLDLGALLPPQIGAAYQYKATAVTAEVEDGQGTFKLELIDPGNHIVWSHAETLTAGVPRSLHIPLPDPPPANVQALNWIIAGGPGDFARVSRVGLEVEGPQIGYRETFLWPYAALLGNFDATTGMTRDRASFPAGDFDATNASGVQAAAAAVAARLGIISVPDAQDIVTKTGNALLALQADREVNVNGVLPHFVQRNSVVDDETAGQFAVVSGSWDTASVGRGYWGNDYRKHDAGTGASSVRWDFTITREGDYEVAGRWVAAPGNATNTPYTISYSGGQTTVRADQTQPGDHWVNLGKFHFQAGTYSVTLSDDANGQVIADAIRLQGPPHIVPGTEYSTIDTIVGLLGTLLASEALGLAPGPRSSL